MCKKYIILDFEANHTNIPGLDVLEIGVISFNPENFDILESFNKRFRPRAKIWPMVSHITRIYHKDVADAGSFWDEFDEIYHKYIKDACVVGHNIRFDLRLIGYYYTSLFHKPFRAQFLDTLSLARKFIPDLVNYRLGTVAKNVHKLFDLPGHRAVNDCLMCHHIMTHIYQEKRSLDFVTDEMSSFIYDVPKKYNDFHEKVMDAGLRFFGEDFIEPKISFYKNRPYLELISPEKNRLKTYLIEKYHNQNPTFLLKKTFKLFNEYRSE